MKIALIGYGKMGHMIEEVALQRGHEIVARIDAGDAFELNGADVAIEFTTPATAGTVSTLRFEGETSAGISGNPSGGPFLAVGAGDRFHHDVVLGVAQKFRVRGPGEDNARARAHPPGRPALQGG